MVQGVTGGVQDLGKGVQGGIAQLVNNPVQGFRQGGVFGGIKGVAGGVVGAGQSVLGGTINAATGAVEGLA